MYRETSKLVIYRNLDADNLLFPLADICEKFYTGNYQKEQLITSIYEQIHNAAVVQIGLKKVEAVNTYSVATFKKLYDFTGEDLAKIKAYALGFREQIKNLNQMRTAEAMTRSDAEPFYEDVPFSSTENGTHFEISSNDVLDGDKDELPI